MQLQGLDLNHLVVLEALLRRKSVTRAAEEVFLSQPATSCALARLREFFDDPLLVKVGRSMTLTATAESMVEPLHDLLVQIGQLNEIKPEFDPMTVKRKLRIEASDYLIKIFLADVITRCGEEAPGLEFDLRLTGVRSSERLDRGETDLLIAPDFVTSSAHPTERLFDDDFSCIAWVGNKKVGKSMSIDKFFSLAHVATEYAGGALLSIEDRVFQKEGRDRRREISVPHFTLIPSFVIGTERIATLQTRLAKLLARSLPLRVMPCPVATLAFTEFTQWHRYQERDPTICWIRGVLQQVARAKFSAAGKAEAVSSELAGQGGY